jgi:membrane protein implicated in regulation of membrane protease activity
VVLALSIVLALFVPWPWSLIVLCLGVVAEAMVGLEAEVASPCRPRGQVRVHGELWEAICEEGADAGEIVRVTRVDGLKLIVERAENRLGTATAR